MQVEFKKLLSLSGVYFCTLFPPKITFSGKFPRNLSRKIEVISKKIIKFSANIWPIGEKSFRVK
jgi:hypothetical protein